MTAIRERRRRATVVGLVAALVGLVAAAGLGIAGVQTLADSTVGRQAGEGGQPVVAQRLPFTSTALLGVEDEDGRLTSLVVAVLETDGTGGSIVQVPVAAEPSSGSADELAPIDVTLAVAGPIAFREAVERLTSLSFDVIEVTDQSRFAQLVTPLGDVEVDLTGPVRDASTQETWAAGRQRLTAPGAARLVTATDPAAPGHAYEQVRTAVWQGIADRVGAGIGSASPVTDDTELPVPATTDEFLARLFAGPVSFRALQFRPLDADEIAGGMGPPYRRTFGPEVADDVVFVDRAEMIMVFGGVAPARLGAPLDAPTFRVVNRLNDADTEELGRTPTDLTKTVVNVFLFSQVNVVSVVDTPDGGAPEVSRMIVADPSLVGRLEEVYEPLFGDLVVEVTAAAIEGIDVEFVLGRSFVERLAAEPGADVAGSTGQRNDEDTGDGANGDDATDD